MYDYVSIEEKWRGRWTQSGIFRFDPKDKKRRAFVVDTPPPFTNGALHMGQTFWVCYIDAIARYKRMAGFNVLYPQGWDAHGFPTEIAVEKKYGKGLPREEFYKKCVEESMKNIATMRAEMLKLGSTFDDKYEYYTTSDDYMAKVQRSVIEMYKKGFVYRAAHPVEWCVHCTTPISREEAKEVEEETTFNYLDFAIVGSKTKMTIATTRPEMLHACVALAVNPKDERYAEFVGRKARIPIFRREVSIVSDDVVDKGTGTGAEMVCTFGDKRDVAMYYKHKLELIEAMTDDGKLKNAGPFDGTKLLDARKKIIDTLKEDGSLVKQEKLKHSVKVHDRCNTHTELVSSVQWFMKTKENSEKIKEVAHEIRWVPEFSRQRLDDWANFIEWDWAISRNRIFGTPIPFWHCEKCGQLIPAEIDKLPVDTQKHSPPMKECPKCNGKKLIGTKETLDGWIDSSITPLVISGWPNDEDRFKRNFPAAVRIQGTDIIRTWAFYTIYRTWALTKEKPWESIISHGMILAIDGREMHKSWGNSIYPTDVMKKYSIDSIRLWVALSGGIVKDRPFSYQDMDFAKSFTIKLLNTANFVKLSVEKARPPREEPHNDFNLFDLWALNRLNAVVKEATAAFEGYALHEAMNKVVNFYWHEFADYYIENVKHRIYSEEKSMQASRAAAAYVLAHVCDVSLRLLAPVIPHVCEEINAMFGRESIFLSEWPRSVETPKGPSYTINGLIFAAKIEVEPEAAGIILNQIISDIRKQKAEARVALNKEVASIHIKVPDEYYTIIDTSRGELAQICKAKSVTLGKGDYSVEVKM